MGGPRLCDGHGAVSRGDNDEAFLLEAVAIQLDLLRSSSTNRTHARASLMHWSERDEPVWIRMGAIGKAGGSNWGLWVLGFGLKVQSLKSKVPCRRQALYD